MIERSYTTKHFTLEEKKSLCEKWKTSGKTKKEFCKDENIPTATFYGWLAQFPSLLSKKEKVNLLPIKIINKKEVTTNKEEIETSVEIKLPNQILICFTLPVKNLVGLIEELPNATAIIR